MVLRVRTLAGVVAVVSLAATAGAAPTPLIDAIKAGNRQAARAALKQTKDVNAAEPDGTTALHWAVRADDVEMARLLLRAGAKADAANRYGLTPLMLAAENGSAAAIDALLVAGADANAALPEGETVLMRAARTGKVDAMRALIARGATVDAREEWQGETALMWAAGQNHGAAVRLLVEAGANVNARSSKKTFPRPRHGNSVLPKGEWTPLMFAAREGALDATRALIESGADLDAVDPDGTTALSYAVINAQFDVAALLIEKGAKLDVPDSAGMTALYAAVDMHTLPWMFGRPDPIVRSKLTSLDIVKLALEHGANPNVRLKNPTIQRYHSAGDQALGEGATPFMRAAKAGDVAVMRLLLEHGARPGALLRNHTTALMIASGYGWRDKNAQTSRDRSPDADIIAAIQLCLDSGLDVNAFNDAGETPLHLAAARSLAIVKHLVEHGAKTDMRDRRGRTPLEVTLAGPAPAADADAPVSKGFDPQVVEYLRQVTPGGARPAPAR
jgi:ankyrin repeat protein